MERNATHVWRRWNLMLNALLVIAALLIVARMVWGLDTQDIVVEWTPEDKKLTLQIPAPTGRLYANEMVDKSYSRFGITEDDQSHIVPTLLHQHPLPEPA